MRLSIFALPLLAASAALAQAQSPLPTADAGAVLTSTATDASCPVGISARRQGAGQMIWTVALEDARKQQTTSPDASVSGVHVELNAQNDEAIRQVELAVHFVAPGSRVLLLAGKSAGNDLKKTFNLAAPEGGRLKLAGDLLIGPSAGITRVILLNVKYADGTRWHAHGPASCSVEPNGLLPVNAH